MAENKTVKVILADDESHIRTLLKTVMKSMDCEITGEAANGEEAVDVFRKERPDLLMLDINMPVKSGLDALKEVMTEFPQATVVMLTSVADMETVEACLDLGAVNYIRKDTPISRMKEIIEEILETLRQEG